MLSIRELWNPEDHLINGVIWSKGGKDRDMENKKTLKNTPYIQEVGRKRPAS